MASHQRQEQLSNAASFPPQQEMPDGEKMAAAEKRRIRKLSMSMDPNVTPVRRCRLTLWNPS